MEKKFGSKEEAFDYLKKNKELLIAEKKSTLKHSDSICVDLPVKVDKSFVAKGNEERITVKSIINTTNVIDSHMDLHVSGIWNKSLKENKTPYLLQEHKMQFDHVISSDIIASAENFNWSDLGFEFKGETQALVFTSVIEKKRNEFMFNQYLNGYVKNHSVGMNYVKIFLAVNSDEQDYKEEKEVWDKYYDLAINKQVADENGYFWAVTEAKFVEGSAVLVGSNQMTPTLSVEPSEGTQKKEPLHSTQKSKLMFNNFI